MSKIAESINQKGKLVGYLVTSPATVIQYHPSKDRYVNTNENCLHLWKPINEDLPTPPIILV
jgi:hypothetical protein